MKKKLYTISLFAILAFVTIPILRACTSTGVSTKGLRLDDIPSYHALFLKASKSPEKLEDHLKYYMDANGKDNIAAMVSLTVGMLYWEQKQYEKAEKNLKAALEIHKEVDGEDSYKTLGVMQQVGFFLIDQSKYPEAKVYYDNVLRVYGNQYGEKSQKTAEKSVNFGDAWYNTNTYDKKRYLTALKYYQKALEGFKVMDSQEEIGSVQVKIQQIREKMNYNEDEKKEIVNTSGTYCGNCPQKSKDKRNTSQEESAKTCYLDLDSDICNIEEIRLNYNSIIKGYSNLNPSGAQEFGLGVIENLREHWVKQSGKNSHKEDREYAKKLGMSLERHLKKVLIFNSKEYGQDNPKTIEVMHRLGSVQYKLGMCKKAEKYLRKILNDLLNHPTYGPDHPVTDDARKNLVIAQEKLGRRCHKNKCSYNVAVIYYRKALQQILPKRNLFGLKTIVKVRQGYGTALIKLKRTTQAKEYLTQALQSIKKVYPRDHPRTIRLKVSMGSALKGLKMYDEAEEYIEAACKEGEMYFGNKPCKKARMMQIRGHLCKKKGQYAEAEQYYKNALEICKEPCNHQKKCRHQKARIKASLARLYSSDQRFFEALREYKKALRIYAEDKKYNPKSLEIGILKGNLGNLFVRLAYQTTRKNQRKKYLQHAEKNYQDAFSAKKYFYGFLHPESLKMMMNLGIVMLKLGKQKEITDYVQQAEKKLKEMLEKQKASDGTNLLEMRQEMEDLAGVLINLSTVYIKLRQAYYGVNDSETLTSMENVAATLQKIGRPKEAKYYLGKLYAFYEKADDYGSIHPKTISINEKLKIVCKELNNPDVTNEYKETKEKITHVTLYSERNNMPNVVPTLACPSLNEK